MLASAKGKQRKLVRQASVRNTVLIISHITFRYYCEHIFSDNLSRKCSMQLSRRNTDTMGAAEWLPVRPAVTPFLALKRLG